MRKKERFKIKFLRGKTIYEKGKRERTRKHSVWEGRRMVY
jgi:hypothetical protein